MKSMLSTLHGCSESAQGLNTPMGFDFILDKIDF